MIFIFKISEIINKPIRHEVVNRNDPKHTIITSEVRRELNSKLKGYKFEVYKFENRVLSHLLRVGRDLTTRMK